MERSAKAVAPFALTAWVSDDAKFTSSSGARPSTVGAPVTLKYRGPSQVTFSNDRPAAIQTDRPGSTAAFHGKAATTVTFSQPGDYILNATANDYSDEGGAGFQCCWTTGKIKVSVQP